MNTMQKISGVIIRGKQKGREMGFPTANLALHNCAVKSGVYTGKVYFDDDDYAAAVFVPEKCDVLEAHIFDFEGDLYGKEIEIEVGHKIREAVKFESEKELIGQVLKDLELIRNSGV